MVGDDHLRVVLGAEGAGAGAAPVCPDPCVWLSATNFLTVAASSSDTSLCFVKTCQGAAHSRTHDADRTAMPC